MQNRSLSIRAMATGNYTTTSSLANITGMVIIVPEDGAYDIIARCTVNLDTSNDNTYVCVSINGNKYGNSAYCFINGSVAQIPLHLSNFNVLLKKDDVVSLQAVYLVSHTVIESTFTNLEIIKRGL